jgi:hypothetical protein
VISAAERLRAAGHTVHTPDYYDGEVFDDLDEGMRKEEALGYQEISRRARKFVGPEPRTSRRPGSRHRRRACAAEAYRRTMLPQAERHVSVILCGFPA